jgi:hypothetical protein
MVSFDHYDNLPKQEEMKHRLKYEGGYYDDINYFKSKKHRRFMDFNWYLDAGRKPHSHNWGRKPYWRKKRKEQRRAKKQKLSSFLW